VLGWRALPCSGGGGGGGGSDGRGRGGSAPRLVVDVLVEFHGGGARSTDDDDCYYRRRRRRLLMLPLLTLSSTGPLPPQPPTYTRTRRKRIGKVLFFSTDLAQSANRPPHVTSARPIFSSSPFSLLLQQPTTSTAAGSYIIR